MTRNPGRNAIATAKTNRRRKRNAKESHQRKRQCKRIGGAQRFFQSRVRRLSAIWQWRSLRSDRGHWQKTVEGSGENRQIAERLRSIRRSTNQRTSWDEAAQI